MEDISSTDSLMHDFAVGVVWIGRRTAPRDHEQRSESRHHQHRGYDDLACGLLLFCAGWISGNEHEVDQRLRGVDGGGSIPRILKAPRPIASQHAREALVAPRGAEGVLHEPVGHARRRDAPSHNTHTMPFGVRIIGVGMIEGHHCGLS